MDEAPTLGCVQQPYVARIPKGFRIMNAIQNQFTQPMRDRLQTTAIGLGLVRLLQDARRLEEARTTLYSLESGFQNTETAKSIQKPCKANRLNGVPISF